MTVKKVLSAVAATILALMVIGGGAIAGSINWNGVSHDAQADSINWNHYQGSGGAVALSINWNRADPAASINWN
jgi:hypothetical protein